MEVHRANQSGPFAMHSFESHALVVPKDVRKTHDTLPLGFRVNPRNADSVASHHPCNPSGVTSCNGTHTMPIVGTDRASLPNERLSALGNGDTMPTFGDASHAALSNSPAPNISSNTPASATQQAKEPLASMGAASSHQSTNYSTTSNDSSVGSRATGLMRRFSRGAATKLSRRKQNALLNEGSGPVIIRRRSDSKAPSPSNGPDAIYDSDYEDEEVFDYDGNCFVNGHRTSGGIAPKVDVLLQRGSILTKVSKQRRKQKTFYLDVDSAKVYWDLSNPVKRLYIDNIKEIHTGADARNYREEQQVGAEYEDRWFSIVFACPERSIPVKTIHLIAPSERIFKLWTTTLEDISRYRIGLMAGLAGSGQSEPTLKTYWQREVARQYPRSPSSVTSSSSLPDPDKPLDLPAVETLCRSLHINCSKETLRTQFMRLDKGNQGMIDFTQFQDVLKSLKDRSDLRVVFCELASEPSQGMTLSEFLKFLREVQVEDIEDDTSHWISIFERFVRRSSKPLSPIARALSESGTPNQNDEPRMSFDAFSAFLMSKTNCIYKSMLGSPKFDRPLNEYFISSSHNTYLLGRQVAGSSSTEAYITALQKGCRCLEIDCWDGPDGRPNVCHGRTMTSSVLFSDCITVINRYAFVSSYLPLIISLEVHCNPEQQQAMVDIMKDTFGEKLLLEPLSQTSTKLPTPDELRERILIKVKTSDDDDIQSQPKWPQAGRQRSASQPFIASTQSDNTGYSDLLTLSQVKSHGDFAHYGSSSRPEATSTSLSSLEHESSEDEDGSVPWNASAPESRKKPPRSNIIKSLADLGVYTRGYKWRGFSFPESKRNNHVYSFAERSFESICKDPESKALFQNHNRKYLTRVYPSAFRVRSSNFDPNTFWRRGVQMVALNWQTFDVGMQMNQAMFAAGNDRLGFVLKPGSLRQKPPPGERKLKLERQLIKFSIDVISAQQLPRSRGMGPDDSINPYVAIEVFSADDKRKGLTQGEGGINASARNGVTGIGVPHRRRTRIIRGNGYNPVFGDSFRVSVETKYPDLVFVRWVVWNSLDGRSTSGNSVPLASFTAKLNNLSQGYRYLPLYDQSGDQYLFSTLFCKIVRHGHTPVPSLVDLEEFRSTRVNLFKQLGQMGQAVFKRGRSQDRERERERALCSNQERDRPKAAISRPLDDKGRLREGLFMTRALAPPLSLHTNLP